MITFTEQLRTFYRNNGINLPPKMTTREFKYLCKINKIAKEM